MSGDVMNNDVPLGNCQGSNDRRKRIELDLTIYSPIATGVVMRLSPQTKLQAPQIEV